MLRSIFFSTGLFVFLWGVMFLFVDKLVLKTPTPSEENAEVAFRGMFTSTNDEQQKIVDPPDWAGFSLMSIGSVTMLYAVALPKRKES